MSKEPFSPHDSSTDDVVRKSITVARDLEAAFRLWTAQIHRWWPKSHSISGDPDTQVYIEGWEGGRFYERTSTRQEYNWGRVLIWEPPLRLAFHWYLGSSDDLPTRVDVRFEALDKERTHISIEHRGPELIGERWQRNESRYRAGWDAALRHFQKWESQR